MPLQFSTELLHGPQRTTELLRKLRRVAELLRVAELRRAGELWPELLRAALRATAC